jgi:hypothetical protein
VTGLPLLDVVQAYFLALDVINEDFGKLLLFIGLGADWSSPSVTVLSKASSVSVAPFESSTGVSI